MPLHCHIKGKHSGRRPLFIAEIKWDDEGWPSGSLSNGKSGAKNKVRNKKK
jgi:hypothetical protein